MILKSPDIVKNGKKNPMVVLLCKGKSNFSLSISRNADGYSTPLQLQMQSAWPFSSNFVILTNRKSIMFSLTNMENGTA